MHDVPQLLAAGAPGGPRGVERNVGVTPGVLRIAS